MLNIGTTDRVFVLTGAGISAESGIPTFRDAGGLWRNYRFEEVASPHAWRRDPALVWEFYSMRRRAAAAAKPNAAHSALSRGWNARSTIGFSSARRTSTTCTNKPAHRGPFTCMASFSKAAATLAIASPSPTQISMSHPLNSLAVNAGAGFARTSAGSERFLSIWTGFIANWSVVRCSWPLVLPEQLSPAASFAAHVHGRARTIYVGPEEPANRSAFAECHLGNAGDLLPKLFEIGHSAGTRLPLILESAVIA